MAGFEPATTRLPVEVTVVCATGVGRICKSMLYQGMSEKSSE